ncbi:MAG: hypothetical protein JSS60_08050 [Verrucomicrobia bacterium]|nr:hypothetical protein [Verrucomicrobiota bacterium]
MMTHSDVSTSYAFRPKTLAAHQESKFEPFQKKGRRILPLESTPSLLTDAKERKVNREVTGAKTEFRIQTYFINALAEIIHKVPFSRGHTSLQGSSAPKGWQAAHGTFAPSTSDTLTSSLIEHIVDTGVTPSKTKPFLIERIGLTSPEAENLDENHEDESFVTNFVLSRLPSQGACSIFACTRYAEKCNTTFENPDESNQYDTLLERTIAPFLKELQGLRMDGTDTAEASTAKLIDWLLVYYKASIANIETQLINISKASVLFEKMRAFELLYLRTPNVPQDEFQAYLNDVDQFLAIHEELVGSKKGCPSCGDLKLVRNDFSFLKQLRKMAFDKRLPIETVSDYYLGNRKHLDKPMEFDTQFFIDKYTLYHEEAKAQCDATLICSDPCSIASISKMYFGVMTDKHLRAPTEEELRKQIFALSTIATPLRKPKPVSSVLISNDEVDEPPSGREDIDHSPFASSQSKRMLISIPKFDGDSPGMDAEDADPGLDDGAPIPDFYDSLPLDEMKGKSSHKEKM